MPRHLMVRRFNDSGQEHRKRRADMERTPLIQYGENVDIDDNKTVKFGTSANCQQNYFSNSAIMASDMSWDSLKLVDFDIDDDHDDDAIGDVENDNEASQYTFRATDDNSIKHDSSPNGYGRLMMSSSSPDCKAFQTHPNIEPDISRKDKPVLSLQKFDSTPMSTFREHQSIKNSKHSPGQRNNNASVYGVLGVKKNFLRRSENSGLSRLCNLSPSKTHKKTSSVSPLNQNTHTPKSCKQHSSKYSPSKNVSFSKHVVMRSRFLNLSEHAASTHADQTSSVLENCQLSQKGAEINVCGTATPNDLRNSSTSSDTPNSNTNAWTSGFKFSTNTNRVLPRTAVLQTPGLTSSELQLAPPHCRVLEEWTSECQLHDASENIIDLSSRTKPATNRFNEDNKENKNPLVLEFKRSQSPKRSKHIEGSYSDVPASTTDDLSPISPKDLRISGSDHLSQHDIHISGKTCHIPHDLHIPGLDDSKRTDTASHQQGFTDDVDDDGGDDEDGDGDDVYDDDTCSSTADTENNGVMESSSTAPLVSLLRDSLHPDSMYEEDTNDCTETPVEHEINNSDEFPPTVVIDVVGDLSPMKISGTSADSGVYADLSSNAGCSLNKNDASGLVDTVYVHMSSNGSSIIKDVLSGHPDTVHVDTSSNSDSSIDLTRPDDTACIDMSRSSGNAFTRDHLSGLSDTAGQDSSCRSGLLRLSSSPADKRRIIQFVTPNRQQPKPMYSSTPASAIWHPWQESQPQPRREPQPQTPQPKPKSKLGCEPQRELQPQPWRELQPQPQPQPQSQPQPSQHFVPMVPPEMFSYMTSLAANPYYAMLHSPHTLPQSVSGVMANPLPHLTHSAFRFYNHPHSLAAQDPRSFSLSQYATSNSSAFVDQPLNLSNRLSTQVPAANTQMPHVPAYAASSSPRFQVVSPSAHLFQMVSTSTGMYPIASSSTHLVPGDQRSAQNSPSFSGIQNLPRPSYALPAMLIPDDCPLNSSEGRGTKRKSTECASTEGQSGSKKRQPTKKSRQGKKFLDVTNATNNNAEAKVEFTVKAEAKVEFAVNAQAQTQLGVGPDAPISKISLVPHPPNWRPISHLMKTKEKSGEKDLKMSRACSLRSKENIIDASNETAKQRNKPELYGVREIIELPVDFYDCPERERFCNANFKFQVPKIPDSSEGQAELREALLRLFANSNLPPVPSALRHSVHALSQYPFMQHIFNLHAQGENLDSLKFGAYGLAFENLNLVEMGEQAFNEVLDNMSYLGEDNLLHCLVKIHKNGSTCGHVAKEIGKIRRHSKNHYPDKKWVCVFCRVQMCDMTDLERHTATHTELKPFECSQCSKKFCQKVTLTQHMHKTHGQQLVKWDAKSSYICRQDGCSYSQGDELACYRHLKQHHALTDFIKRKSQNKWPFNVLSEDDVLSQ
ncbi:hypothetical protein BsWGS_18049 [Bradybaena similaris]